MGVDAVLQPRAQAIATSQRSCIWRVETAVPANHSHFPRIALTKYRMEARDKRPCFFSGLYKRDKVLWLGSWSLHLGLLLIIVAHIRVILPPDLDPICLHIALIGSGLMTVSGTYLLLRRIIVQRVREITDFRDYLAEIVLLFFSATAFLVVLDGGVSSETLRHYVSGLLTGTTAVIEVPHIFFWHMLAAQLLLIVIPFSHLLHLGGIFLSREFLGTSDTFAGEFGSGFSGLKDGQDENP